MLHKKCELDNNLDENVTVKLMNITVNAAEP